MSRMAPDATSGPIAQWVDLRVWRQRRSRLLGGVGFLVLAYAALLYAYAAGGGTVITGTAPGVPAGGVLVVAEAESIDAAAASVTFEVRIELDDALVTDGERPAEQVTVTLLPTVDDADLTWVAHRRPAAAQATLVVDGDIQAWPFDGYDALVGAQAYVGPDGATKPVPTALAITGNIQGWHLAVDHAGGNHGIDGATEEQIGALAIHRTVAIIGTGLLLVGVLITLGTLGLTVAISCLLGRRRLEATMLSWGGAMLFAALPIRNFFPGSPPPGSWVDIAVVLWVLVALGLTLVAMVRAWWRQTSQSP